MSDTCTTSTPSTPTSPPPARVRGLPSHRRPLVHLRMCMACGHIGCCDSSPHRHATGHWHASETTRSSGPTSPARTGGGATRTSSSSTWTASVPHRPTPDVRAESGSCGCRHAGPRPPTAGCCCATVLGSGMAYLDATVVNVALPALSADLDTDVRGLQWVLDAYLVSLTGLLLLGGALGDLYGRRAVFRIGAAGFAVSSVLCGLAPTTTTLSSAPAAPQGVAGGATDPGQPGAPVRDHRRGGSGPHRRRLGGAHRCRRRRWALHRRWLVDTASWRWAFFINVPVAAVALAASAHVDESFDHDASRHLDLPARPPPSSASSPSPPA